MGASRSTRGLWKIANGGLHQIAGSAGSLSLCEVRDFPNIASTAFSEIFESARVAPLCTRQQPDAFTQWFLDGNWTMLKVPRQTLCIGQVGVEVHKRISWIGHVKDLLDRPVLMPTPKEGVIQGPRGQFTRALESEIGFQAILPFLQQANLSRAELEASAKAHRVSTVKFSIDDCQESIVMDLLALDDQLQGNRLKASASLGGRNEVYLITGLLTSNALSIETKVDAQTDVDAAAKIVSDVRARAHHGVAHIGKNRLAIRGDRVIIAIRVHRLRYDRRTNMFQLDEYFRFGNAFFATRVPVDFKTDGNGTPTPLDDQDVAPPEFSPAVAGTVLLPSHDDACLVDVDDV